MTRTAPNPAHGVARHFEPEAFGVYARAALYDLARGLGVRRAVVDLIAEAQGRGKV